eukprot:Clim_evm47s151 gene=Clim_evmTU47s151
MGIVFNFSEGWAVLRYSMGLINPSPKNLKFERDSEAKCYDYLDKTSRSFAAVIRALDGSLRNAVCIFYLVLRGLDTVEDDMTIEITKKIAELKDFHAKLYVKGWTFNDSGPNEKDAFLLKDFGTVIEEFQALDASYQVVIADICREMGHGMAKYLTDDVDTVQDWDEYCHYVAGLVGIGLSRLFSASAFEDEVVGKDHALANSMGLFLQKTNIIRDYHEDILEGRIFWPREVWSRYAGDVADFKEPKNIEQALKCLNALVANALGHLPDVLAYMERIRTPSIFQFCAIPQAMAVSTIALCYNNPNVFKRNVKIRKSTALVIMDQSRDFDSFVRCMDTLASMFIEQVPHDEEHAGKILSRLLEFRMALRKSKRTTIDLDEEDAAWSRAVVGTTATAVGLITAFVMAPSSA